MENKSILIVDDEASIRVSLEDIFKKNNYEVETTNSASTALEKLANHKYDLVLTDIKMGKVSGTKLLKDIKEKYSHVVVVLMTGYASIDSAIKALRLGASDYIVKPCSKKKLLSSIESAIKNNNLYGNKNLNQFEGKSLKVLSGKKPLTKKELLVCDCLLQGLKTDHMSTKLNISVPTVKFHLKNIYTKLGIEGRREILRVFHTS
jgi:DNA-binding NarL/FixJ family response regulator